MPAQNGNREAETWEKEKNINNRAELVKCGPEWKPAMKDEEPVSVQTVLLVSMVLSVDLAYF